MSAVKSRRYCCLIKHQNSHEETCTWWLRSRWNYSVLRKNAWTFIGYKCSDTFQQSLFLSYSLVYNTRGYTNYRWELYAFVLFVCVSERGRFRPWTKATAKQATNDTFIRVRDAAPECRPLSQLLLVTELDTSHKRQSHTQRQTVCFLDSFFRWQMRPRVCRETKGSSSSAGISERQLLWFGMFFCETPS